MGDLKYKDQNGDGKIDGEDRVYLGSWDPSWTFGLNLSATWKGFDASVFFQGAADVKGFLQNETVGRLQGNTAKPTALFRDSWDAETNPNGKFPRPLTTWRQNDSETNTIRLLDHQFVLFANEEHSGRIHIAEECLRLYTGSENPHLLQWTELVDFLPDLVYGLYPEAPVVPVVLSQVKVIRLD